MPNLFYCTQAVLPPPSLAKTGAAAAPQGLPSEIPQPTPSNFAHNLQEYNQYLHYDLINTPSISLDVLFSHEDHSDDSRLQAVRHDREASNQLNHSSLGQLSRHEDLLSPWQRSLVGVLRRKLSHHEQSFLDELKRIATRVAAEL